ncbi:MAG: DUF2815 family protein [Lachnospiraceae bacterium]|nr:DUF2815 family protein [Lachnospiraceae bacterium]
MSAKHPTKCTIPAQISYANLNQPRAFGDQPAKYGASLIVSKKDEMAKAKLMAAMKAAYDEGISVLKGKSKTVPTFEEIIADGPLHDGDLKKDGDPAYKGAYYLNAKNSRKPLIINTDREEILDPSEIYSGIYAKCAIGFYAYNKAGNRGIGCSLDIVMKTADGDPLGTAISVDEAFAEDDDEASSDDLLS